MTQADFINVAGRESFRSYINFIGENPSGEVNSTLSYSINSLPLMESDSSLPSSQEPARGPCPEPNFPLPCLKLKAVRGTFRY
jgi:hypothetical protein